MPRPSASVDVPTAASGGGRRVARSAMLLLPLVLAAGLRAHGPAHERIQAVTERLKADPSDAGLLLTRAELYRTDGDTTNAVVDLDRAAAVDPTLVAVDYVRGRVLLDAGRAAEAVRAFDRYLGRKPDNGSAFLWRARARAASGDGAGAASDYDSAIRLEPMQGPDPYLERARHVRSLGPDHREEALRGVEDGLGALGSLVSLELEAVDLELELGRPEPALARLGRLAERSQRPELWRVRRAEILAGLGQSGAARQEWEAAAAACGRLPARLRQTRAVIELEARIAHALGRAPGPSPSGTHPSVAPGNPSGVGTPVTPLRLAPARTPATPR